MTTTEIYLHALEEIPTTAADAMDRVLASLRSGDAPEGDVIALRSALRSNADRSSSDGQ
jgi:hypothetical protein